MCWRNAALAAVIPVSFASQSLLHGFWERCEPSKLLIFISTWCHVTQTRQNPPVCRIKEQPCCPEVFLLDHQRLPAARGRAYPQFSLSRDLKCVKELQGLNPQPVPIVSDNGNGILHRNLDGLQKLHPHQHWDFNPYKDLGKEHPWGIFFPFWPVSPINISLL